jgi:AcrR family transcriptional regulator
MRRRAELVDGTRQRITEATVRLHTTVGPAHASISAIAEEAGVTRLTVYRHFSDLDQLFEACMGHWLMQNPPPDSSSWTEIPDVDRRAHRAFGDLYGWYDAHGDELLPIHRDFTKMPQSTQTAMTAQDRRFADALLHGFVFDGPDGDTIRAVAGHLVAFSTWRSLQIGQGLTPAQAVALASRILVSVVGSSRGGARVLRTAAARHRPSSGERITL